MPNYNNGVYTSILNEVKSRISARVWLGQSYLGQLLHEDILGLKNMIEKYFQGDIKKLDNFSDLIYRNGLQPILLAYYIQIKEKASERTVNFSAELETRGLSGTGQHRHGNSLRSHYIQHKK